MSNLEKPDRHSLTAICWGALCRHASPRVLLALLALAVALTMAGHFFKRGSADWLVEHVPASWAQAASDRTLHRLDASVLKPSALPLDRQTAINTEFAALRVPQGEPPLYRLVFRRGGALGARGFTLAGGQIVVTDEWVQQFGNDRALLTALSTQLGHLQHRDALRSAIAHARLGMLLALFRGDAETATRLMSDAQPVLEYDERSEQAAARFSTVVMQANP